MKIKVKKKKKHLTFLVAQSVAKYDLGYLLIVGMHLVNKRPQDFTLVMNFLKQIIKKFSKKGSI